MNNLFTNTPSLTEGLEKFGIKLSSDDLETLCKKYDVHGKGTVNFSVFLKKFSSLGRISALGGGRGFKQDDRDSHMVSYGDY